MKKEYKTLKSRRRSRVVMVGNVGIGGNNPVRVQSMTNTDTLDAMATAKQIEECVQAGAELMRVAAQTPKQARKFGEIRKRLRDIGIEVPLIADVHYLPEAALEALKYADKIRLNPGNFLNKNAFKGKKFTKAGYRHEIELMEKSLLPLIEAAKQAQVPLRIGANFGSLSERVLARFGNTPEGVVESVMEYVRIFYKHEFKNLVVAIKAADPLIMIESNRRLADAMERENVDCPIHLGVTEAGSNGDGRAKSTIGIGTLLLEGIGDTIRVSLTEHPAKEIPVCYSILQATGRRITKTEFISCPGCGRVQFDIERVAKEAKEKLCRLKGLRIAIMGCAVNGPGEMGEADFGCVGSKSGMVNLYCRKKLIQKNIPENEAVDALAALISDSPRN